VLMCKGSGQGAPGRVESVPDWLNSDTEARHLETLMVSTEVEEPELVAEVDRLRAEYHELQAQAAEADASDGVAYDNARIHRLRLSGLLQRYSDRPPTFEETADRYVAELEDAGVEVLRLWEENMHMAVSSCLGGGQQPVENAPAGCGPPRVRSAAEELYEEVRQMQQKHFERENEERRTMLKEWHLEWNRKETKRLARHNHALERVLLEARDQHGQAQACFCDLQQQLEQCQLDVEEEKAMIQELTRVAISLRETCHMPARLKREGGFLMRMLDQGCGRHKVQQHLRGLDICKRLYDKVAAHAPTALVLAGRAKTDMETQFAHFVRLEEAHGLALQRVQHTVTRGLLQGRDGLSLRGAA